MEEPLFTTLVRNDEGLEGMAYVVGGGLEVLTSNPLNKKPGTNPEELIGLSWSTCLNATIEYLLRKRNQKNIHSEVEIQIDYLKEEDSDHTYFRFFLKIQIDLPQKEAEEIAEDAHQRCPVSKIAGDYPHVSQAVFGTH